MKDPLPVLTRLKIWDSLNCDEADAKEVEFDSWGWPLTTNNTKIQSLVATFVENRWAESDYPETTEISVRTAHGDLLKFVVYAEQSVHFRAAPKS